MNRYLWQRSSLAIAQGGMSAQSNRYPWLLRVGIPMTPFDPVSGASLLVIREGLNRSDMILTAAHSMVDIPTWLPTRVVAGDHSLDAQEGTEQSSWVEKTIYFGEYEINRDLRYDIALVKISAPFDFTDVVHPIRIPDQGEAVSTDAPCVFAGWGHITSRHG